MLWSIKKNLLTIEGLHNMLHTNLSQCFKSPHILNPCGVIRNIVNLWHAKVANLFGTFAACKGLNSFTEYKDKGRRIKKYNCSWGKPPTLVADWLESGGDHSKIYGPYYHIKGQACCQLLASDSMISETNYSVISNNGRWLDGRMGNSLVYSDIWFKLTHRVSNNTTPPRKI